MKRVPFLIIEAAKQCDDEAVNFIRHHFEGYMRHSVGRPAHGNGGRHGNTYGAVHPPPSDFLLRLYRERQNPR